VDDLAIHVLAVAAVVLVAAVFAVMVWAGTAHH
jgi:hypothetical protein